MLRVTSVRPGGRVPPSQVPDARVPDARVLPGQAPPSQVGDGDVPGDWALVELASRLGAASVAGWSAAERDLVARAAGRSPGSTGAAAARDRIRGGEDPLGDAFCALRGPSRRRVLGQTFTPPVVIESMVAWAAGTGIRPARVVDPGSGSARMLLAAGRRWPQASLVGVEIDPLAAIVGRASLAAAGFASRSSVLLGDYRTAAFPPAGGPTLFLGNPPYVRHHQIAATGKEWLRRAALEQGVPASGLSGLHAHFFLATAGHAVPGDLGVLITAAEWLDVNYGRLVRELLLGALGGQAVHLVEPTVSVFADATATSVITCFRPCTVPGAIRMRRVAGLADLGALAGGTPVPAAVLRAAARWGPLLRPAAPGPQPAGREDHGPAGREDHGPAGREDHGPAGREDHGPAGPEDHGAAGREGHRPWAVGRPGSFPDGHVELGELCRVHRGQVTGANAVWVTAGPHPLIPDRFCVPAVTRARELIEAGPVLPSATPLRLVISLPADLGDLPAEEHAAVAGFLRHAAAAGAADSYVARHRRPWWRVRLGAPPPILASYMSRRPPVFVRNQAAASYLNIAHGLYPRDPLPPGVLDTLAAYLGRSVTQGQGRVYAGGLVKFEPREMERLPVPGPALLAAWASEPADPRPIR
jgi:adenine-specific DNA-methyltransferase